MAHLLKEEDVRNLLSMDDALSAVEDAFRAQAAGNAVNVPRQRGALPGVTLNVLCAVSTALDAAGVKCYPIVRQDVTVGSSFTMLVYKVSTGALIGVLEANALGQIRTGAASGVATKYMARPDSRIVTLFGVGWQAESQLEAVARVLPKLERVNVFGRSRERAERYCENMNRRLRLNASVGDDPQQAVAEADVIITVTGSAEPVFDGRWLRPGVHINAVGSNFPDKRELDETTIARAGRIVVDDIAVAKAECGDLLLAQANARLDWNSVIPLCQVVAGAASGRQSPAEITLFESHGLGLEDLAVASRVLDLAQQRGTGMHIPIS